jgi:adenylate cyclase
MSAPASWTSFIFGEKTARELPARIRASIADHERRSEILIGWAQLFLVFAFGTFYLVSPKTGADLAFQPVPWALGLYLFFTVLRLLLAYRGTLSTGFLVGSVVADVALLMVLIWSFHIQYEQPASFYLKAPTLLYVFIFIALRALRFDPKFIIVAGAAAAVGWMALMVYVVVVDPNDTMITRDYVSYMTSNAILIGAEVDKILSVAMVTLVLAIAVTRARRTLEQAVLEHESTQNLSRFVASEVADRIITADKAIEPGDGEDRIATVMFTDIEGFSTISERMDSECLVSTMNDYFGALSEAISRNSGIVLQFEGDAMLISFNTVTPDPDHAAHAIRTALEIQECVNSRTFGPKDVALRTRCGINTGTLTAGAVGSKDRMIFTVHGDEVNVAARLEQLNKDFGTYILMTESTADAVRDVFATRRMGETVVRGRVNPTQLFTVAEVSPDAMTTAAEPAQTV